MKTPNSKAESSLGKGAFAKLSGLSRSERATTLVECLATLAVFGIGIGSLMAFNTNQLRCVRSTHEITAGSLSMQERVEQMRIANWRQLTDAAYIKGTFFATRPACADPISSLREELSVTAYPNAAACPPLKVSRLANGQVNVVSYSDDLDLQRSAKAVLDISWIGQDGRNRKLQSVAVLSNGGINRLTLPAFGQAASGTVPPTATPIPFVTSTATPTPAPVSTATPTPAPVSTATPTPAPVSTATPTPLPPTNPGNGRGNVSKPNGRN